MLINERLKIVRQTLNLTQKVFAKSVFISTCHYTMIETGNRTIKDSFLDSVCKIYNVKLFKLEEASLADVISCINQCFDDFSVSLKVSFEN